MEIYYIGAILCLILGQVISVSIYQGRIRHTVTGGIKLSGDRGAYVFISLISMITASAWPILLPIAILAGLVFISKEPFFRMLDKGRKT